MRSILIRLLHLGMIVSALATPVILEARSLKLIDGFVIGDPHASPQALVVGVGDSTAQLIARNPFISELVVPTVSILRLPVTAKLDVTYDDGSVRFKVGCASRAGLDGNQQFGGVAYAGFGLCEEHTDDWQGATKQAFELMQAFQHANPRATDVKQWTASVSRQEWVAMAGDTLIPREILSQHEANERWAELAAKGHPRAFQSDTFMEVGVFRLKRTLAIFMISKEPASEQSAQSTGQSMAYRVGLAFMLLASAEN